MSVIKDRPVSETAELITPSVLLLTDTEVFAGTERHILDLAIGLTAAGVRASIGCPAGTPLEIRAAALGVSTIGIKKIGVFHLPAIASIARRLRSGSIDIVHAHNGRTALLGVIGVALAGRGVCVKTQHFIQPSHVSRRGLAAAVSRRGHAFVNRRIAHVIAIGNAVRDSILQRGEADAGSVTVIPNGISDPDVTRLTHPGAVRDALGVSPTAPLIVCAARLSPEKDVASLIAAMKTVATASPDATCVVAGEGSEREVLQRQIEAAGLTNRMRLLGFQEDAFSLIQAADLFVLPSLAEPFGLVLLEAMALARPVVSTRAGGPMEIVEEGETGLLIPPGNVEQLSAAILSVLSSPERGRAMGEAGRRRYTEQFTVDRMAQATLEVYRRCDDARTAGSHASRLRRPA